MKATELMPGDLVRYTNPPYIRVASITRKKIGYHIRPDEPRMHYVRLCEIEPAPITPEFLEKNGWEYNDEEAKFAPRTWSGGGLMLQEEDDCGYRIVVTSDYDDEDTNHTPFVLHFVHELQHALRLRHKDKEIQL